MGRASVATAGLKPELSPPTFCTFAREFSAFTARGCSSAWAASDPGDRFGRTLERPHGPVLPAVADGAKVIQQQGDAGLDKTTKFFGNRLATTQLSGRSPSSTAASTMASLWSTIVRTA